MIIDELFEAPQQCPECGGISFSDLILAEKKDACYYKVKASAKVWPSAYASGRLVQCRKKGAANYGNKSESVAEGKVKLYTDPSYFGAEVDDTGFDRLPAVNIPTGQLVGFEPDDKMNQPKSKANVEKIVAGLKKGDKLPPILVRKYKNGYQVLDGHHRFWAYKLLGVKSIPSRIVPDSDIEEIGKQGVTEEQELDEKWSQKYKSSINCANPKGFSQKAHCAGRKKNEDVAEGEEPKTIWHGGLTISGPGSDAKAQQLDIDHELGETRRGQVPMTLKPGETDNLEPENIAAFRQLPAYKQGQAAQQKAGKQLIQKSPYTFQSDQDWAYRQGAFDTQQAAMFANFGKSKPLTVEAGGQKPGADYIDPPEDKDPDQYGDEYQAMVARVRKLAGLGPMKTVYDPNKRVYRNMPTAQQPPKK